MNKLLLDKSPITQDCWKQCIDRKYRKVSALGRLVHSWPVFDNIPATKIYDALKDLNNIRIERINHFGAEIAKTTYKCEDDYLAALEATINHLRETT